MLAYTADGFVPATIEPRPLKDVSAITFLGAEVAAKHPVVTTWKVPPPSTVDYEKEVIDKGPYLPLRTLALDNAFPVLQGYKNYVGIGYHANIADPLAYANVGITAAYTPTSSLPGNERATWKSRANIWVGAARCRGIDPISTICSVPPSAAARDTRPNLVTPTG